MSQHYFSAKTAWQWFSQANFDFFSVSPIILLQSKNQLTAHRGWSLYVCRTDRRCIATSGGALWRLATTPPLFASLHGGHSRLQTTTTTRLQHWLYKTYCNWCLKDVIILAAYNKLFILAYCVTLLTNTYTSYYSKFEHSSKIFNVIIDWDLRVPFGYNLQQKEHSRLELLY